MHGLLQDVARLRAGAVRPPPGALQPLRARAAPRRGVATLQDAGTYAKWLVQLAKAEVLVLDDWGPVGLDDLTRQALMEVIDDRAGVRATIVTS